MAEYSNINIYVLLKSGSTYPIGLTPPSLSEGANTGILKDGRAWFKNCFLKPSEMRDIVHAEDAGKLQLKTSAEMRAILDAQIVVEKPL